MCPYGRQTIFIYINMLMFACMHVCMNICVYVCLNVCMFYCSSSHSDFHSFISQFMYMWLSVMTSLCETALDFGIGETKLSNTITEVCKAFVTSCGGLIYLPTTAKEWQVVAGEFAVLFPMPNTVGAIDGSHIPIVRPEP